MKRGIKTAPGRRCPGAPSSDLERAALMGGTLSKRGCLLLPLPAAQAGTCVDFASTRIDPVHLADGGVEDTPHITVKHGFLQDDPDTVQVMRSLLGRNGPVRVKFLGLSLFPNSGDGEVLKLDVESAQLHELHLLLSSAFKCEDRHFPFYKPHLTVAYIQPGYGHRYLNERHPLSGKVINFDSAIFSAPCGENHRLLLSGRKMLSWLSGNGSDLVKPPEQKGPKPKRVQGWLDLVGLLRNKDMPRRRGKAEGDTPPPTQTPQGSTPPVTPPTVPAAPVQAAPAPTTPSVTLQAPEPPPKPQQYESVNAQHRAPQNAPDKPQRTYQPSVPDELWDLLHTHQNLRTPEERHGFASIIADWLEENPEYAHTAATTYGPGVTPAILQQFLRRAQEPDREFTANRLANVVRGAELQRLSQDLFGVDDYSHQLYRMVRNGTIRFDPADPGERRLGEYFLNYLPPERVWINTQEEGKSFKSLRKKYRSKAEPQHPLKPTGPRPAASTPTLDAMTGEYLFGTADTPRPASPPTLPEPPQLPKREGLPPLKPTGSKPPAPQTGPTVMDDLTGEYLFGRRQATPPQPVEPETPPSPPPSRPKIERTMTREEINAARQARQEARRAERGGIPAAAMERYLQPPDGLRTHTDDNVWRVTTFPAGGATVQVNFQSDVGVGASDDPSQTPKWWVMDFTTTGPDGRPTTAKTGAMRDSAHQVFSGVGHVVDRFLSERRPPQLSFAANREDETREALYDRLASLIAHHHGYTLSKDDSRRKAVVYTLTRKPEGKSLPTGRFLREWAGFLSKHFGVRRVKAEGDTPPQPPASAQPTANTPASMLASTPHVGSMPEQVPAAKPLMPDEVHGALRQVMDEHYDTPEGGHDWDLLLPVADWQEEQGNLQTAEGIRRHHAGGRSYSTPASNEHVIDTWRDERDRLINEILKPENPDHSHDQYWNGFDLLRMEVDGDKKRQILLDPNSPAQQRLASYLEMHQIPFTWREEGKSFKSLRRKYRTKADPLTQTAVRAVPPEEPFRGDRVEDPVTPDTHPAPQTPKRTAESPEPKTPAAPKTPEQSAEKPRTQPEPPRVQPRPQPAAQGVSKPTGQTPATPPAASEQPAGGVQGAAPTQRRRTEYKPPPRVHYDPQRELKLADLMGGDVPPAKSATLEALSRLGWKGGYVPLLNLDPDDPDVRALIREGVLYQSVKNPGGGGTPFRFTPEGALAVQQAAYGPGIKDPTDPAAMKRMLSLLRVLGPDALEVAATHFGLGTASDPAELADAMLNFERQARAGAPIERLIRDGGLHTLAEQVAALPQGPPTYQEVQQEQAKLMEEAMRRANEMAPGITRKSVANMTPEEREVHDEMVRTFSKLNRDYHAQINGLRKAQAEHRTKSLEVIGHQGAGPSLQFWSQPHLEPEARSAVNWVVQMVPQSVLPSLKVAFDQSARQRAYADLDAGVVYAGADMPAEIAAHEVGHLLEKALPGALEACLEFRAYRTHGDTLVRFKDMPSEHQDQYKDNEVGYQDRFAAAFGDGVKAAYTGKVYDGDHATEILSRWCEYVYRDAQRFAKADPEFFAFGLMVMRGAFARYAPTLKGRGGKS